jgi:hypothetical protein
MKMVHGQSLHLGCSPLDLEIEAAIAAEAELQVEEEYG